MESARVNIVQIDWNVPLPAPAKLNLFLHVVGRRADGYHLLQTVFRFIDRCDQLTFSRRSDGELRLARPLPGVPEGDDLVIRAAQRLREAADVRAGATIVVEKNLPMGGGLGGGSSDAATTLLALNHLWDIHWPRVRLAELGVALGADVPVFVHGQNAFAEGVGDVLSAIELPPRWYLVVVPQVSVPTREIFADPALTRDSEQTTMATFFAGHKDGSVALAADPNSGGISLFGRNDLEPVAVRRYAEVGQALEWLNRHAPARMTGSGACVFAEFGSERAALEVAAAMPAEMQGFTARGLATHPLAAR